MVRLLEMAEEMQVSRMTLEVRAGNLAAQELYRRFDFDVAGRRPHYYTDDGEDALVMTTPRLGHPSMRAALQRERDRLDGEPNA